ncbi:hypothetical protein BTR23_16160 [Alkalihalophilus pseudofirmus]|nr:hypothetical protein BTR23_16160 [Alkalihalophilus pseudofirmus]
MEIVKMNSWSLYLDFIDAFSSLTYKGISIAWFVYYWNYLRIKEVNEELIKPGFEQCLKNKVLTKKQIQSGFNRVMDPIEDHVNHNLKDGKILLYDELNLRFTPNNYLEYFDSSTTVILRKTAEIKSYLGIPIDKIEDYKNNVEGLIEEYKIKAKKLLHSYKNHPIFSLPVFQKRFIKRELPAIVTYLVAIVNYFERRLISCVLVGGEVDYISRMLIIVAKTKGIPSICLQHGIIGSDRGWLPILSTKVAAFGQFETKFYQDAGVPKERIEIIGHPRFDRIFTEKHMDKHLLYKKIGISPNKKTVLITTQPVILDFGKLRRLIKCLLQDKKFEVIIQPHPTEIRRNMLEGYRRLVKENTSVKLIEFDPELYNIIPNVDVVCVYNSTTGIEAMLFGKPVVYFRENSSDGAHYDYCDKLIEPNPMALANIIIKLTTDRKFQQYAAGQRKAFISKAYPQQISGKKLSDLIYTLSGVRSYR